MQPYEGKAAISRNWSFMEFQIPTIAPLNHTIVSVHLRESGFPAKLSPVMPSSNPALALNHVTFVGKDHLPSSGGYLILPNQLDYATLLRIESLLTGRKVMYVMDDGVTLDPQVLTHVDKDHITVLVIVPDSTDSASYRSAMKEAVAGGHVVIHLPGKAVGLTAPLTTVPGARIEFLVKGDVPVVPCYVQRTREVSLPTETHADDEVIIAFGAPLIDDDLTLGAYQESLYALAEQCFSAHPMLNQHLGYALLTGLKRHAGSNAVIDGKDDSKLSFGEILAAALALSGYIRAQTKKPRVGIVLPPSPIGLIANIAVLFAGKTPVNMNFTAGRAAVESSIKQSDLDKFLTADTFVRKVQTFPWPPTKNLVLLERLMPTLKVQCSMWFVLSKILPTFLLAALARIPKLGGNREATVLFTSGSSGEPKGVVLTHRNLISNVAQFGTRLGRTHSDSILGCLPLFHSFGCTVTLWYPIIYGINVVFYPSPLETKKLAELIQQHKISILLATPTFLRGYLRGVNREQLASLKLVVTGAEKLPKAVSESFETRFGKRVLEGYGLTETSPVSNVNLPDPEHPEEAAAPHVTPAYRLGSVGQLLPGMAIRITNADTNESQSINQPGVIWFKGANVFTGYLNDPKRSNEVLDKDGWFRTGDVGRVDQDGFLYIEGRLSRFSKIAGEMVPHETVEEAMVKALGLENESTRRLVVVGVPDIDRGEALVLLTTLPGAPESQEIVSLRHRLLERGVPPLWIPKKMIRVSDIPVLASGKLDVKGCEKIARAGSAP